MRQVRGQRPSRMLLHVQVLGTLRDQLSYPEDHARAETIGPEELRALPRGAAGEPRLCVEARREAAQQRGRVQTSARTPPHSAKL